eukprot:gene4486-8924_t
MANRLYGNGGGSHNSYASIDDEESADSERFQPMRSRLFTFEGLTGIQDNKQSDVNNNVQQFLVDLASGVASTFLQFVFAMTYAAGCFSGPRTNSLFGYGVMMTAISAVLTQVFYSWRSEISYLFVSPDGFYIPLINALGDSLSSIISDDQIFRNTFLFSIVLTTFTVGMAKFICGHFNFVQFTDYIPYPAICGLMAGIAYEKALSCRFNKSLELKKYGIATILTSLFGGVALQNNLNNKIINSLIRQNSISHLHLNSNSNIYQIPSSSSSYFTPTPATTTTLNNNNNKSSTKSTTKSNKSNQSLLMEDLLPYALIIHMNDVIGCDASAMDTFNQIVIFCRIKKCRLIFCTLNENELILFEKFGILSPSLSSPTPTMLQQEQKQEQQQKHSHVFYEEDLDTALRNIENCLISHYKLMNKTPKHDNNNDNIIADGFLQCLQLIHKRYPNINIKPLEIFSKYIITIDFIPGQIINSNVNNNNNNNTSSTTSSNNKDKECSKEAEGMFFLENGTIQHLISLEYNEIDIGKDFGIEIETDPTVVNTIQQQQQYNRLHDNNNHNNNHGNNINHLSNKKRLSHLNLVSDSHTCSWGSKHGPGWIFEESTSTSTSTHFNFDREISTYCAHTSCRVHYISGTHLKQAYENNPQSANTLLQLQLAVTKQQLSIATEHLSNLSDVLHFRSSKKKNL